MPSIAARIHWKQIVKLTLLLDLDDTLIGNDIEIFLPQYIRAFQETVASFVEPQRFVKALMTGTERMAENLRPDCTLKEVFDASFFPELGVHEDEFKKFSDKYYSQIFPTLKKLIRPRQEAVSLVKTAVSLDYRLAVATNPLFPLTANLQRLQWGDLPVDEYRFELVSSYETFHYAKPNPAFFAEVLARMGWPDGPVIVVGDDINRDIKAARQLGVLAYWVSPDGNVSDKEPISPSKSGDLSEFLTWLYQLPEDTLLPDYSSQSAMLAILRATPAALDSICREMSSRLMTRSPKKDEWSITEILCHLRDVEGDVNLPRLHKGIKEDNPFLAGENTNSWAEERNYRLQDGKRALQEFIRSRMELLELIRGFEPIDWERTVRHSIFGPTSLTELIRIIASHDRLHMNQVHQVVTELSI